MLLIIVAIFIITLYLYGSRNYKYWENRGVKYEKPFPFLGSVTEVFLQKASITQYAMKLYKKHPNEKVVGFYMGVNPAILLRDLELVKHILVTDFHRFYRRGLQPIRDISEIEPMLKNLFHIDGDNWKLLRQRLTPAFTSGRLKAMFPIIVERAEKLKEIAADAAETGKEVDIKELIAKYTTDFIGAVGFGLDLNSLKEEDSVFRKLGKRMFTITKRDALVRLLRQIGPDIFKNLHVFAPEVENPTIALVAEIMQRRNYKPCGNQDFIDFLLELKQKTKIVGESIEKRNPDGTSQIVELEMDELIMAAQVFVFFAAGFETSSTTSSFTFHQLAFHPEDQRKCQEEIDEVLSRHGGKLSYDAVKEMKYLEMCFKESMRLMPSLGIVSRKSADKYTLPNTDVTIDESVMVIIPINALQTDSQYFKDPEKFKPERFHPDNAKDMKKFTYLPFGEGPRACIGERLGLMQSIAGLAAILSKFSVEPSRSTLRHPVIDPRTGNVQSIKGGLPLALSIRK